MHIFVLNTNCQKQKIAFVLQFIVTSWYIEFFWQLYIYCICVIITFYNMEPCAWIFCLSLPCFLKTYIVAVWQQYFFCVTINCNFTAAKMTQFWARFKQNDLQNCAIREILAKSYRIVPQNCAELVPKLLLRIPLYVDFSILIP